MRHIFEAKCVCECTICSRDSSRLFVMGKDKKSAVGDAKKPSKQDKQDKGKGDTDATGAKGKAADKNMKNKSDGGNTKSKADDKKHKGASVSAGGKTKGKEAPSNNRGEAPPLSKKAARLAKQKEREQAAIEKEQWRRMMMMEDVESEEELPQSDNDEKAFLAGLNSIKLEVPADTGEDRPPKDRPTTPSPTSGKGPCESKTTTATFDDGNDPEPLSAMDAGHQFAQSAAALNPARDKKEVRAIQKVLAKVEKGEKLNNKEKRVLIKYQNQQVQMCAGACFQF